MAWGEYERDNVLFSRKQGDQDSYLRHCGQEALKRIDGLDDATILQTNEDTLCNDLEAQSRLEVPVLNEDAIPVSDERTKIDVSQDRERVVRDRSQSFLIDANIIRHHVPFTGLFLLFQMQPSTYSVNPPFATIGSKEHTGDNVDAKIS